MQWSQLNFEDLHFARRSYGRMSAYAQSKAANVLFAKQLATRYGYPSTVRVQMQLMQAKVARPKWPH